MPYVHVHEMTVSEGPVGVGDVVDPDNTGAAGLSVLDAVWVLDTKEAVWPFASPAVRHNIVVASAAAPSSRPRRASASSRRITLYRRADRHSPKVPYSVSGAACPAAGVGCARSRPG